MMLLATQSALAAPVGTLLTLQNGGFEAGLDGWDQSCLAPSQCGQVGTSRSSRTGASALSVESGSGEWTSTGLRQQLTVLPAKVLRFSTWARPTGKMAPAMLRLKVDFDQADSANASNRVNCQREWIDLPSRGGWKAYELLCATPLGAARAWVSIQFACVRADASLLVDDVTVREQSTGDVSALASEHTSSVPRRLHFIFGLVRGFGGKPFSLVHYLVVRAAAHFFQPETMFFHHVYEPSGEWWMKARPLLTLRQLVPPSTIFGRTIRKFQHQADVVRLELLLQFGGLYMDMDVLLLNSVDDLLAGHELVLAQEGVRGSIGLGNAMMIAQRNATMLRSWYGEYRSFSDKIWNNFSLRLPMQLRIQRGFGEQYLSVLEHDSLYWPPWNAWGLAQMYRSGRCMMPHARAVHLWETKMWASLLSKLTVEDIKRADTCFTRLAAAVLDGSFAFAPALIEPGESADTEQRVLYSSSLLDLWSPAERAALPVNPSFPQHLITSTCTDLAGSECAGWATSGECERNTQFMNVQCTKACAKCQRA